MQDYIAFDNISKEILNSAKLLKSVKVNALIVGEFGCGKKSLAKYILNDSNIYKAKILQDDVLNNSIQIHNESIIVDKIDNITNIDKFISWVSQNKIRVIATSKSNKLNKQLKDLFLITLEIPSLNERILDTNALMEKFSKEASLVLNIPLISLSKLTKDISNNVHSLRKSIYFSYLFETIGENEIFHLMEKYFQENLVSEKTYKDLLYLFEVPLLKVATSKYKSQVKIAKYLNLNRITLRKKLEIHKDLLCQN